MKSPRAMTEPRAILFDLDGVIIDSEPLHERSIQLTSQHLGGRELTPAELLSIKGTIEELGAAILLRCHPGATLSVTEIIAYRNHIFTGLFDEIPLIPGAREFIATAQARGLSLGLTTSALPSNQQRAFAKFDLAPFFETVVTGDDITRGKPDLEPYLLTAARLGVLPAESLVIEDSLNGVRSGKAAGCRVAALTTSFPAAELRGAGADDVLDTYAELAQRLGWSP